MAVARADYEEQARAAVPAFWGSRDKARRKQLAGDRAERGAVTGGKTLDGFVA